MNEILNEITKDIQAVAVKLNLNALKEFAYSKGYSNKVNEFKRQLMEEVKTQNFPKSEEGFKQAHDYIRAKYFGGKITNKQDGIELVDLLFTNIEE